MGNVASSLDPRQVRLRIYNLRKEKETSLFTMLVAFFFSKTVSFLKTQFSPHLGYKGRPNTTQHTQSGTILYSEHLIIDKIFVWGTASSISGTILDVPSNLKEGPEWCRFT